MGRKYQSSDPAVDVRSSRWAYGQVPSLRDPATGPRRGYLMPRANQHRVEQLDFAIKEWTLDDVRLVEVLGRSTSWRWVTKPLPPPRSSARHLASPSVAAPSCPEFLEAVEAVA
jgi:hypothetical protein